MSKNQEWCCGWLDNTAKSNQLTPKIMKILFDSKNFQQVMFNISHIIQNGDMVPENLLVFLETLSKSLLIFKMHKHIYKFMKVDKNFHLKQKKCCTFKGKCSILVRLYERKTVCPHILCTLLFYDKSNSLVPISWSIFCHNTMTKINGFARFEVVYYSL